MAKVDSLQEWVPSDGIKDCSHGFCSIYCPQWCYVLFPPPPPSALAGGDDSGNSSTAFSPLVITIIGILASALLIVSYYTFVSAYCSSFSFLRRNSRRHPSSGSNDGAGVGVGVGAGGEWHGSPSNGLEEELINKIRVYRYKTGEKLVDGMECSVCLAEFREDEILRLLPKCSHAFHLHCIDTWLISHSNCPLCRSAIVFASPAMAATPELEEGMTVVIEDVERSEEEEEEEIRRSSSMGSSHCCRTSMAEVMHMSMEEEITSAAEHGVTAGEIRRGEGRSRGLHCVMSPVRMKRSSSRGRSFFAQQGRGKNSLLTV